ncbi:BTB domain-containing protein [Mycena indigotica]|uniref:BTB domain-containing protein n=1 Tax=Mycena indigotica TaxID=2126181 RepID=A0A8H6VQ86_9AGAR|nr:BTB domain-containing protein [Mycena indigotica]KAF7289709.1 BTB domain-containing protein [Mycena indigotica]
MDRVDPASESSVPIRADGLWFTDCGLVLRAENTVFRVSRDFMVAHSPIFRDMLALPTPADAETFEGCPLVGVPDSAYDMTNFLKALIHYNASFLSPHVKDNALPVLLSALGMCHKYDVAPLCQRLSGQLAVLFPTTLAEFEDLVERRTRGEHNGLNLPEHLIDILLLARRLSLEWLLPFVFYELCRCGDEREVLCSDLSVEDKHRWVVSYRRLAAQETAKMLNFLWADAPGCIDPRDCLTQRMEIRRQLEAQRAFSPEEESVLPLEVWPADLGKWTFDACAPCIRRMRRAYRTAKHDFWAQLPRIFDLPPWSELEKMKKAAFVP